MEEEQLSGGEGPKDNIEQSIEPNETIITEEEKTPEQLRTEHINSLGQELDNYEGPRSDQELAQRLEDIRHQYVSATENVAVSDNTREELSQKMEGEIAAFKERMNGFEENRLEVNRLRSEDMITSLESLGAKMSDESKTKAIELLSSPQIVHVDRRELIELLGIDKNDKELIQRLSRDRAFFDKYGKLLREQLVGENQEMFLGADIKLAGGQEVQIDDETIDLAELSDSEIASLGEDEIKHIIASILRDKESSAGQGMFWNVLVPKDLEYVLKTERKLKDLKEIKYSRESLLRYPIIRDNIGKEFLPKQAVLQTGDSEQLHVLQEKMPLSEMTSVRNNNIDGLISGEYGQEIVEALKQDKNKKKLRAFVEGVEKLYEEHKLMIDTIGDNLFFSVSEDGELDIKLVDYGAFKQRWEEPSDDIKESFQFIKKLKSVYL
jgi:hypothetical protein